MDPNSILANVNGVEIFAMIAASTRGRVDVVESLIEAGADINKATKNGTTALIVASMEGHAATVKVLLQAGADVNKATENGLMRHMAP